MAMYMFFIIVIEECKAKLVASEEEQQELLQVIEQTKRMGYAKDLQISMLESDGQLKSKYTNNIMN